MKKIWTATIHQGKPIMTDYVRANFNDWAKQNEGKQIEIKAKGKKVSENLRGFYFAAYIPLIRSTCDEWKHLNGDDLHEVIKKCFFYFETYNPITKRTERFGRSVMSDSDWNDTEKAGEFLNVLNEYLVNCGVSPPDSEEFKHWRDSAPLKDQKY